MSSSEEDALHEQQHRLLGGGNSNRSRANSRPTSPNGSPRGYLNVPIKDEYNPMLEEKRARLLWSVRGHGDSIASLEIVEEPRALLSASYDHTVRFWGTDGNARGVRLGSLLQGIRGKTRHPKWNFHVNATQLEEEESKAIHHLMKDLASRRETMVIDERRRSINSDRRRQEVEGKQAAVGEAEEEEGLSSDLEAEGDTKSREGTEGKEQEGKEEGNITTTATATTTKPPWTKANIDNSSQEIANHSLNGLNNNGPGQSPIDRRGSGTLQQGSLNNNGLQPEVPDNPDHFDRASYEQFQKDWFQDHPRRSSPSKNNGDGNDGKRTTGKKDPSFSMSKGVRNPHRKIGRGSKKAALSFDRAMDAAKREDYVSDKQGTLHMEESSQSREARMQRLRSRLSKYGFDGEGNDMYE